MAMPGYSNEDFARDGETYKTADRYTQMRLEKKWGARADYFRPADDDALFFCNPVNL